MKEKINVYLFWGDGCPHCETAKLVFKKLARDNGEYFNLIEKEVWNNDDNAYLLKSVSEELNAPADGVPYIVIGNKVFGGISDKKVQDEVVKTIKDCYNDENYVDFVASAN